MVSSYNKSVWPNNDTPLGENDKVAVFEDMYPVITGHLLFVPKENTAEHQAEAYRLAIKFGNDCIEDETIDGYNVGQNIGVAAGQSVMWPHVHFIPRKEGDSSPNAANGIRLSHPEGVHINETRNKP